MNEWNDPTVLIFPGIIILQGYEVHYLFLRTLLLSFYFHAANGLSITISLSLLFRWASVFTVIVLHLPHMSVWVVGMPGCLWHQNAPPWQVSLTLLLFYCYYYYFFFFSYIFSTCSSREFLFALVVLCCPLFHGQPYFVLSIDSMSSCPPTVVWDFFLLTAQISPDRFNGCINAGYHKMTI